MRIKICGLTNTEDIHAAIQYGADALGFIFVPQSPRYIGENEAVRNLLKYLPPFIARVGVCATVDTVPESWLPCLDVLQFYTLTGQEARIGKRVIHAFRVRNADSLDEIETALAQHQPEAILLDTYHKDKLGGSGETFNWQLAIEAKARFGLPLVLAGGLVPENVAEAVARVKPYAVDVSSGVEAGPGRKDHARLRSFLRAARAATSDL